MTFRGRSNRLEIERLRRLNESLAARLAAASEVLGRCAEKGKIDASDVEKIVNGSRIGLHAPDASGAKLDAFPGMLRKQDTHP